MSIIVPVYNVKPFIRRCMESIVNQQDFNNFEIILINDGTQDGSIEEILDIVLKHPNIHLVNQENRGLSEARNTGIRLAKGEFISFIDSDDWIEPDMISSMYSAAIQTNSEVAICNIRAVYEGNARSPRLIKHNFRENHIISSKQAINHFFFHKRINGQVCNKIFKAELFKDYNITFPAGKHYEDLSTCFFLLWHSKKVVFLDKCFYNYLQRKGSITKKADLSFWHKVENAYSIKDFLRHKNEFNHYSKRFSTLLITILFEVYIHLQKHKNSENYVLLKKRLNEELTKFNQKNSILFNQLHPMIRMKLLIMSLKFDFIIDYILKVKAYRDKANGWRIKNENQVE